MSIPALPDIGADKIPSHVKNRTLSIIADTSKKTKRTPSSPPVYHEDNEDEQPVEVYEKPRPVETLSQLLSHKSVQYIKDNKEIANSCLEWLYELSTKEKTSVLIKMGDGISVQIQTINIFEDLEIGSVTLFVAKSSELVVNIPSTIQLSLSWGDREIPDCFFMGKLQLPE
jgi:hypothetical protein